MELYEVRVERPGAIEDVLTVTDDKQKATERLEARYDLMPRYSNKEVFVYVWKDGEHDYCTRDPSVL